MTTPGPSVSGQPTDPIEASDYARIGFGLRQRSIHWDGDAVQAALHAIDNLRSELAAERDGWANTRKLLHAAITERDDARSQLAEAREQVVTLKAAAGMEPDTAVDFVAGGIRSMLDSSRLLRTQIRPQLARAEVDAEEARAERDSLREERDRLVAAIGSIAATIHPRTWSNPTGAALADVAERPRRLRALAATASQPAPAEPPVPCLASDRDLFTNRPLRCTREAHSGSIHSWVFADEPEPPAAPVQPEERRAWPALAARLRTLGLPGLGDDPAEITDQVCRWLETLHEQARTQARVIVQYSGERDEARAALATAERERDEAREEVTALAKANMLRIGEWTNERMALCSILGQDKDARWVDLKEAAAGLRRELAGATSALADIEGWVVPERRRQDDGIFLAGVVLAVKETVEQHDALRAEVQRIAAEHDAAHPECAPFGTTISNDLRAALGSTPDTPQEA